MGGFKSMMPLVYFLEFTCILDDKIEQLVMQLDLRMSQSCYLFGSVNRNMAFSKVRLRRLMFSSVSEAELYLIRH